jgi:hypothetical protein
LAELTVIPTGNRLEIGGVLASSNFRRLLAGVHKLVEEKGYQDLALDFRKLDAAFTGGMLPICAHALQLRNERVDININLPEKETVRRLFLNANWAWLLEPRAYKQNHRVAGSRVPALRYSDVEILSGHIDRIVSAMLSAIGGLSREQFAAAEWSLNEIADNVLMHAGSPVGGLLQLDFRQGVRKGIEFVVADAGLGVPATLREAKPGLTDEEALEMAVKEGVTRNPQTNQGNGLFGTFEICRKSKGTFSMTSCNASLVLDQGGVVRYRRESIPFRGTVVDAKIDLSDPALLSDALRFKGRPHIPADHIEHRYESGDLRRLNIELRSEVRSFGSRVVAKGLYQKLENLIRMCPDQVLILDFDGVPVISSSFADEVFGRLFVHLGPVRFSSFVQYRNISETVAGLIDRAIKLRFQQSLLDNGLY